MGVEDLIIMSVRRRRSWIWILAGVLLFVAALAVVSVKALSRTTTKIPPEKLVKVERIDLARSVVATGKIEPTTKVEVKSKASGIILKLPVNVGDTVRQAEAALAIAVAALKSAEADYGRTKVDAEGPDLPFLKRDMERTRTMYEQKVLAQTLRDDAEKAYQLALNRQRSAQANLSVAEAAIRRADAAVDQARAILNQAEEDLRNATIVSPIDGVVMSRDREPGDAVSSILTMGSGATLIMTLGDLREVYVKGRVDESDIGKVYLGQPARITVESYRDRKFQGKVTKISPMGVEKDNVTTFEVRVSISNETRQLLATMTANAEVLLEERKGVLAVPEGAIIYKKDRSAELEVPDGASDTGKRRVPVMLGITNGSKTQVLSGVSEGQQVVLQ